MWHYGLPPLCVNSLLEVLLSSQWGIHFLLFTHAFFIMMFKHHIGGLASFIPFGLKSQLCIAGTDAMVHSGAVEMHIFQDLCLVANKQQPF